MSPAVENKEAPVYYLGNNRRNHGVYVFIVNLDNPEELDPIFFDQCLGEAVKVVRLAFPNAINGYEEMVRNQFKWVGYPDKLVVFNESFDHIDVRDLVKESGLVKTKALGAGMLDLTPDGKLIYGSSGTLLEDKAFIWEESERYKLEDLPTKLGREHFIYER